MLEPFEAFNEFVKDYAGGSFSGYADSYRLAAAGKEIALLGFNSALMCGRRRDENNEIDDKGKLMVGEQQVYDSLRKNQDADLRIVVLHHPFDWLTEQDYIRVETRLKQEAHFILCGHQHRPKVTIETGTSGDCIIIPAGASYDRRKAADPQYNNAYNFVHLDFANNKGAVYLRCWSDRLNKWREDIDAYKNGCFDFPLPNGLSTGTDITPPAGIVSGDNQSTIVMDADLKIIEQIEKQIGKKLKHWPLENIKNIMIMGNNGYFLNHVEQVQGLNLDGTKVKDISILGNLGGLTHLSLAYNQITDLTPLRTLTNLRNLELRYNKIGDITPLASLTYLERLILINTGISDISPLSGLIDINTLSLSDNKISDLSPLIPLTSLTSLQLNKNKIDDLTPLRALTQLEILGVRINRINDLIPLKELTNLIGLDASKNKITKLPPDIDQWWSSMKWIWKNKNTREGLNLFGNPLTDPPVETVKQGRAAVKNYFDSLALGDSQSSIRSSITLGFENDIFVSYCHYDNDAPPNKKGWVDLFHENLESLLVRCFGPKKVFIWRDKKLKGSTLFDERIQEQIRKSALFFALLSPNYLKSEYCLKELEWFYREAEKSRYGLSVHNEYRIFNVLLRNIPHSQWPKQLQGTSGFPMHDQKEGSENFGKFLDYEDKQYREKLGKIVDAVETILNRFPAVTGTGSVGDQRDDCQSSNKF